MVVVKYNLHIMKIHWIVENLVKEKSFRELQLAIQELGYPLIEINGDYTSKMLEPLPVGSCVLVNGSIKMVKMIRDELIGECYPIHYCNFEKYKCSAYYSHYGPYLFNDKYAMMSLKEICRQKYDVWGHYGKDAMIFIRPDSGEKTFQAGLLDIIDIDQLHNSNKDCEHDMVLVSTPKNILWEGRFVVSKHKEVVAYSTYRFQGNICLIPSVPPETLKFCKMLLEKVEYYPDSVFCLDICQSGDGNPFLLELTSFSSAGLYACNKNDIVKKVSQIAEDDHNQYYSKIK